MKTTLLTLGNPKIEKGTARGYFSAVLHLAPSTISGYNVCPLASAGCKAACLNTAGRGSMFKDHRIHSLSASETVARITDGRLVSRIHSARIRRTKMFFEQRDEFMALLLKDITRVIKYAREQDLTPVIRLNGTSDIRWETVPVGQHANVMEVFPDIQFYDYTKLPNRRNLPANYHLTFSLSESNDSAAMDVLKTGGNVAVVFRTKDLPETFMGVKVHNGDTNDLRFLDPTNVIVGLKAKGRGKYDTTGFVR